MSEEKINNYRNIVRTFTEMNDALYLLFTTDDMIARTCRQLFNEELSFAAGQVRQFDAYEKVILEIKRETVGHKMVLFIEHDLESEANICFTRFLKLTFPDVYVIFITSEIESERVIYLYENGIDNCITKPVSPETLVEKIAFTVEPPSKIRHLIEFGKKALLDGLFAEALNFALKVLEIKPKSAAALMLKGDALKGLNRREEALQAYLQASECATLFLEPLKKLAEFYQEVQDFEHQLKYLEKLSKLSPLNLERKVVIGSIHARLGREDQAESLFEEAISLAHEKAKNVIGEVRQRVIRACLEHAPRLAERYLREDLSAQEARHNQAMSEMAFNLGLSLRRQGRWQEAVVEYQKALEHEPDNSSLFFEMAQAYGEGEDFKSAAATLDEFFESDPVLTILNEEKKAAIVDIYRKAQEIEAGKTALRQCLDKDPDNAVCLSLLQALEDEA